MPKKPRGFTFSLRMLLAVVTLAAFAYGGWAFYVEPYRLQQQATRRFFNILGTQHTRMELQQAVGSGWQRRLVEVALGKGSFVVVRSVEFPQGSKELDILFILERSPSVERVVLDHTTVTPDIVDALSRMRELDTLQARYSAITDQAIANLSGSITLQHLMLTGNPITDESMKTLADLDSLRHLFVRWTKMTADGVQMLQAGLPDAQVFYEARVGDVPKNAAQAGAVN